MCRVGTGEPSETLGEDETTRALFRAAVWGFWLQLDLSLLPAGLLSSHFWSVHAKPASSAQTKSEEQPSKDDLHMGAQHCSASSCSTMWIQNTGQLWLSDGDGQIQRRGAQSWHASFFFLVGGQLIYNVVVVSAIHQCDSVIIIYIYMYVCMYIPSPLSLPPLPVHPSNSSRSTRLGPLCYTSTFC